MDNEKIKMSHKKIFITQACLLPEALEKTGDKKMYMFFTTANGFYIGKLKSYSDDDFSKSLEEILNQQPFDLTLFIKKMSNDFIKESKVELYDDNMHLGFENVTFYPNCNFNNKVNFGQLSVFADQIISFGLFDNQEAKAGFGIDEEI